MCKVSTAEWILSFAMSDDHAAATAGDLLELASTQGSMWFWMSVLGVFATSVVGGLFKRPRPVIGVAVGGFFMQFLAPLPFLGILWAFPNHQAAWVAYVLSILTLTQYAIGRSIAVHSRGNPAAVCIAIGLLNGIAGAFHVNNGSINMAIWQAPAIVGVILAPRRLDLQR
jgi:hypothetical protein